MSYFIWLLFSSFSFSFVFWLSCFPTTPYPHFAYLKMCAVAEQQIWTGHLYGCCWIMEMTNEYCNTGLQRSIRLAGALGPTYIQPDGTQGNAGWRFNFLAGMANFLPDSMSAEWCFYACASVWAGCCMYGALAGGLVGGKCPHCLRKSWIEIYTVNKPYWGRFYGPIIYYSGDMGDTQDFGCCLHLSYETVKIIQHLWLLLLYIVAVR